MAGQRLEHADAGLGRSLGDAMVRRRWRGAAALALLAVAASCDAEVAIAPGGAGGGGAGGAGGEAGAGGGEAGANPGPPDVCDAFDGLDSCCQVDGCAKIHVDSPYYLDCISADKLCYFDYCTGKPIFEADCEAGFECIIRWSNNTTDDCNGGETCAAERGYCFWAGS